MPKYLPYFLGVPPGREVWPTARAPASNAGVVLDDRVCSSAWVDPALGIICGICAVFGRIP